MPIVSVENSSRQMSATWRWAAVCGATYACDPASALVPGSGGIFEVRLDGEVVASNRESKKMPAPAEVKRLVRDRIAPQRRIGHE